MPKISANLGYYPKNYQVRSGDILLCSLPSLKNDIVAIEASCNIHKDWYYAPAKSNQGIILPFNNRIFHLPQSHCLNHDHADNSQHLDFLVWCLGFFVGMRLTTTEAGFLDATPIKPGKLSDFVLTEATLTDTITLSEGFWQQHKKDMRNIKLRDYPLDARERC